MGQRASRALAGRLEKGMQKYRHEMEQDIYRNIAEKKKAAAQAAASKSGGVGAGGSGFTDPNAMDAGFTRGTSAPIRQDQEQEAFLKSQQTGAAAADHDPSSSTAPNPNPEMPDELIRFLQDMGPVERRETKGPRLRKHQLEEQEELMAQQQELLEEDQGRQKRDMPIMEDTKFTTTRTTNFSRRVEHEDPFARLTGRQLFQLLQDKETDTTVESMMVTQSNIADDDEKTVYADLLQNALKYLQVPVIMKDTDGTYVGVSSDNVQDMRMIKLKEVPDSEVRILLSVQDPEEQNAKAGSSQTHS